MAASWVVFFFFLLLETALNTRSSVVGDSTEDFINIDCGIPDRSTYTDAETQLQYVSDSSYADTGTNYDISSNLKNVTTMILKQEMTLRSFPQGRRNCYTLPAEKGTKYLIRATFLHGNYDGSAISADNPVLFELHLGVNLWQSVTISDPFYVHRKASAITVALAGYIFVCLKNIEKGTPFISSLELRPLQTFMYPNATESVSLITYERRNYGAGSSEQLIRYPDDKYDRLWWPARGDRTTTINTASHVSLPAKDIFMVPSAVLQTAVVPHNDSDALQLAWNPPDDVTVLPQVHIIMHFAEIQLQPPQFRKFNVYLNDLLQNGSPIVPQYLFPSSIHTTDPYSTNRYNFCLTKTASSALPPILNAMEIYSVLELSVNATDAADVDAIGRIKKRYMVNKYWNGDPCAPKEFTWEGLSCSDTSDPPRIISINLSSSGLTGTIDPSFAELKAVTYLDLSYNNLTGTIPAILAELPSLQVLDLTSNQLNGQIPTALLEKESLSLKDLTDNQLSVPIPSELLAKSNNGSITLRIGGNPGICSDANSCEPNENKRKKTAKYIIVIVCAVAVVLLFAAAICLYVLKRRRAAISLYTLKRIRDLKSSVRGATAEPQDKENHQLKYREFTYNELENITSNFARIIGRGGFGIVYHGRLEDSTEVAVKISQSSSQETSDFLAEAQHLTRVHHRNLVSMVGYCMDGDHLALICEYMSEGTLKEHINGTRGSTPLSWGKRLRIALEVAQGLEYLHIGCMPPLIHRDVKTANILLNERLEAKISDFGISRTFSSDSHTHTSTRVVGTVGYLDPEYHITNQLSQKSDVFSYGVVLLELITGRPPVVNDPEATHIVHWVRQRLANGNIDIVIDSRLQQQQEEGIVNSAWQATNIALACAAQASNERPTMTDVVMQLRESLALFSPGDDETQLFQNPYIQSRDAGQSSALDMEQLGILDSEGPSAR